MLTRVKRWRRRRALAKSIKEQLAVGTVTNMMEMPDGLRIEGKLDARVMDMVFKGPGLKRQLLWENPETPWERRFEESLKKEERSMSIELSWLIEYLNANTRSWTVSVNPNSAHSPGSRREYINSFDGALDDDDDIYYSNDLYQIVYFPLGEPDDRIAFGIEFKEVLEKAKAYLDKELDDGTES